MPNHQTIPIETIHLLPKLDGELIALLKSLTPDDWQKQTIAKKWLVKDVAAHLLDGNIRILSILRDNYHGEKADIRSHQDLLNFLNGLNADWVRAMKRVSPAMLILLLEATGPLFCNYYASLDPFAKAGFAVDWAGETESKNWMHIAREYTEKWLHQQQIRNAVNKPGLFTREYFYPFIETFMLALPHAYRNVNAVNGTSIKITVTTEIGGSWFLSRSNDQWQLSKDAVNEPATEVRIEPDIAWRLFSKSLRSENVKSGIVISGDKALGETALTMVSVMA